MTNYITKYLRSGFQVILLIILLSSCVGKQAIKTIFQQRTPHEAYEHNLREAKLHQSALGQAWIEAAQRALQDSLLVTLPFQETAYFQADKPRAASYSFMARQGEVIDVRVTTKTRQNIKLFLDLYEIGSAKPREAKHVAAADTTALQLEYQVDESLVHLVRIQPELLQSGGFTVTILSRPSLSFPVQGKDSRAVQSFWGADRDGGSRKHEGVDIFASRGTPVLASTHGTVSRVGEGGIGGKVVWLTDINNRQSLYYAHLDKQLVQTGQQVKPGDVLGLVGNTGNARSTVPHLHFGVYTFGRGAVDPFPFIYKNNNKPAPLRVSETQLGKWGRVAKNNATVRIMPTGKGRVVKSLTKHTPVQVLGGTDEWFRVQLPDGLTGFLHESNLESLAKPVRSQIMKAETEVKEEPAALSAPIAFVKKNSKVSIMGVYNIYQLVRLTDGTLGWLPKS